MIPTHVSKVWTTGDSALGIPIINQTGTYTLFAEFENNIIQQDFIVLSQAPQVKILKGSSSSEQKQNYSPQNLLVVIGLNNTVTWINEDETTSSVTSDIGLFDSKSIFPNHIWAYTFKKSGLYAYHSEPHPWMKGAVIVIPQNLEFLSMQQKKDIAWYLLQQYWSNPITALGVDNDGSLFVGIHEDELKKNPNAESYYIKKFQEMIPFYVPIRIQFGHVDLQ